MVSNKLKCCALLALSIARSATGQLLDYNTQLKNKPTVQVLSSTYNYAPISLGVTLTGGVSASVTITCPLGLAGTNTIAGNKPQLIYIFGGTGTAEVAAIQGGTCPGTTVATGTIIFTPVNNHSSSSIKSASSGVQEAIYATAVNTISGNTGAVLMNASTIDLWGNIANACAINIPDGYNVSLRGLGVSPTVLRTHTTTGDWICSPYNGLGSGVNDLGSFTILDNAGTVHTSGAMIHLYSRNGGTVDHIKADRCYDCIIADNINATTNFESLQLFGEHTGFYITGTQSQLSIANSIIHGDSNGVRIENTTTVGIYMSNLLLDSLNLFGLGTTASAALSVREAIGKPTNELILTGSNLEGGSGTGLELVGGSSLQLNNSIEVANCRINALLYGVAIYNLFNGAKITNSYLVASQGSGAAVLISGASYFTIQNNSIMSANGIPFGIAVGGTGNVHGDISGNIIGKEAQPVTGISLTNIDDVQIHDNYISASGANFTVVSGVTNLNMYHNKGINDISVNVASAGTTALPINPTFTLTGTTGITAVTSSFIAGTYWTFIPSNATPPTVTLGASIGNSCTLVQNQLYNVFWDGTLAWFSGPGCSIDSNVVTKTGTQTITGAKTFTGGITSSGTGNAIIATTTGAGLVAITAQGNGTGGSYGILTDAVTGGYPLGINGHAFSFISGSCGALTVGAMAVVTDSNTNTWGATVAAGGANKILAFCDGTNWTVAAK